jgi:hypothetical protein
MIRIFGADVSPHHQQDSGHQSLAVALHQTYPSEPRLLLQLLSQTREVADCALAFNCGTLRGRLYGPSVIAKFPGDGEVDLLTVVVMHSAKAGKSS